MRYHTARFRVAQYLSIGLGRAGELHPRAPIVAAPAQLRACGFSVHRQVGDLPHGASAPVCFQQWAWRARVSSVASPG